MPGVGKMCECDSIEKPAEESSDSSAGLFNSLIIRITAYDNGH